MGLGIVILIALAITVVVVCFKIREQGKRLSKLEGSVKEEK